MWPAENWPISLLFKKKWSFYSWPEGKWADFSQHNETYLLVNWSLSHWPRSTTMPLSCLKESQNCMSIPHDMKRTLFTWVRFPPSRYLSTFEWGDRIFFLSLSNLYSSGTKEAHRSDKKPSIFKCTKNPSPCYNFANILTMFTWTIQKYVCWREKKRIIISIQMRQETVKNTENRAIKLLVYV